MNRSFEKLQEAEEDGVSFQVFSKVVSVVVSNPSTKNLSSPVNITFTHLQVVHPVSFHLHQSTTSLECYEQKIQIK